MFADWFANYPYMASALELLFDVLLELAPIWVPIVLFIVFLNAWLPYIRQKFLSEQDTVLLEVRIPKDIQKSPKAMELMLMSLQQVGANSYLKEAYWDGKVRPWFSLEMASFEGDIHFFIWTWKKMRRGIETAIYAQYPTVEIYEVPDYTQMVEHDNDMWTMWGGHFILSKPDPYPIMTYIDYGMDKDPKEEYKIDPMASVIEYLGSLGEGEYAWMQIMVMAHKPLTWKDGYFVNKKRDWKDDAKDIIDKIKDKTKDKEGNQDPQKLTPADKMTIESIERSVSKFPFETMIRGFYIARNENFDGSAIGGLIGSFRQYSSQSLNGFRPGWFTDFRQKNIFDHAFLDPGRRRRDKMERTMLDAYKRRSFFHEPYRYLGNDKPYILTTEELATIFHFPSGVVTTPTFKRVLSKKVEAPSDLPV